MKNLKSSLQKCLVSFGYAFKGIGYLLKNENNIHYQLIAGAIVIGLGVYLDVNKSEWMVLIILIGLVLMAEAFNTAIEKLCDFVHPDHHPNIGIVKDLAAGAVLLISITAAVVGVIIFWGRFI
jgi:diacylglycerol kinase (ATP)